MKNICILYTQDYSTYFNIYTLAMLFYIVNFLKILFFLLPTVYILFYIN